MNPAIAFLRKSFLLLFFLFGFSAMQIRSAPVGQWCDYSDGLTMGIRVVDEYAFVAALSGFLVFDLSDPANPRKVATLPLHRSAYDLTVIGNRAYVAASTGGLEIIDISNPVVPVRVGRAQTQGDIWDVSIAGEFAYLASTGYGLEVVDISDETNPQAVGGYRSGGSAGAVTAAGDYVYLGDGLDSFKIFSVTNPITPTLITNYTRVASADDWPDDIIFANGLAYVADTRNVVVELDLSDPTRIVRGRAISSPREPKSLRHNSNTLFVAANREFAAIDITPGATIQKLGAWRTDYYHRDLDLLGSNMVVLASEVSGLHVLSISNIAAPELIGSHPTAEDASDVVIRDDIALVPGGRTGLALLDLSDPARPRTLSRYFPHASVLGAAFIGTNHAVVALGTGGVDVIDISARTNITRASLIGGTNVTAVGAAGSLAFVAVHATAANGNPAYYLRVLDLSNPAEPAPIGEVAITASANYIVVDGNRAYLSQNASGFSIIDISNPSAPQRLLSADTPGNAQKLAVRGGQLFLADSSAGLRIYDVTNALAPRFLSALESARFATGVAVRDNTAYLANGFSRQLIEVDISDVMLPTAVSTNLHVGRPAAAVLHGEHLYIAEGAGGVAVYYNAASPAVQVSAIMSGSKIALTAHDVTGRQFTEADLAEFALESSANLESWEKVNLEPSIMNGGIHFEVERSEQYSFYRVARE